MVLRMIIIDFLKKNRQRFEALIDVDHYCSWNEFICRTSRNGTYASALVLHQEIIIHQYHKQSMIFGTLPSLIDEKKIHLIYDEKLLHYHSVNNTHNLYLDPCECILV
jgi:hypothetical protein